MGGKTIAILEKKNDGKDNNKIRKVSVLKTYLTTISSSSLTAKTKDKPGVTSTFSIPDDSNIFDHSL